MDRLSATVWKVLTAARLGKDRLGRMMITTLAVEDAHYLLINRKNHSPKLRRNNVVPHCNYTKIFYQSLRQLKRHTSEVSSCFTKQEHIESLEVGLACESATLQISENLFLIYYDS
jgi:hypothetical protein